MTVRDKQCVCITYICRCTCHMQVSAMYNMQLMYSIVYRWCFICVMVMEGSGLPLLGCEQTWWSRDICGSPNHIRGEGEARRDGNKKFHCFFEATVHLVLGCHACAHRHTHTHTFTEHVNVNTGSKCPTTRDTLIPATNIRTNYNIQGVAVLPLLRTSSSLNVMSCLALLLAHTCSVIRLSIRMCILTSPCSSKFFDVVWDK